MALALQLRPPLARLLGRLGIVEDGVAGDGTPNAKEPEAEVMNAKTSSLRTRAHRSRGRLPAATGDGRVENEREERTMSRSDAKHVWIGRRFLPERHGQPCWLLVARRGHFLIRFADGKRVTTVRGTFRRLTNG